MQARMYLPWFGRFANTDPALDQHFEETQSWNIYSYVQNQPTMKIDPTGETGLIPGFAMWQGVKAAWTALTGRGKEAKQAAQGAAISVGTQVTTDAMARAHYHALTEPLKDAPKGDPLAGAARTAAKELARSESSPMGATIAEKMRPMAEEAGRLAGTAGKTNAAVDSAMSVAGKAGPALLVVGVGMSVKEVADAPEGQKFRAAAGESGAWAGAISFGTVGGKGGAAGGFVVGGPPGAAIGGFIGAVGGGILGAFAGKKAATNAYDAVNN